VLEMKTVDVADDHNGILEVLLSGCILQVVIV
jgi:hypothetical protein